MTPSQKQKILSICDQKYATKGDGVRLSIYASFANLKDTPALLMEAASTWIQPHLLDDDLGKAVKIRI